MSNSIYNVKSFMSHNNIQEGVSFPAEVTVLSSAGRFAETTASADCFSTFHFNSITVISTGKST